MKIKETILNKNKSTLAERGGMMVELLLTLALVAIILPFIVNFQKSRIDRAQNIAIAKEMKVIQSGLEKYIDSNKKELLKTVGKNITRVKIEELEEYGVPIDSLKKYGDNFQIRIIKSGNTDGHSILQGVIVLNDKDISPIRTREIINLGDDKMGFVEENKAFGAFGTWHGDAVDFGIGGLNGIIKTTETILDSEKYLWRLPSTNETDATMLSNLNLSGHNIISAKFVDSDIAKFEEIIKTDKIISDKIVFQNRTTVDKNFNASDAVVSGTLSSDSRGMEISNNLNLADTAKLSSFTTNDLWATNLNLSGLSISTDNNNNATILKINKTIDMVAGHITAMFVTVSFDGSITPKLVIKNKIEDSTNPDYFWNVSANTAYLSDATFPELTRMASLSLNKEYDTNTKTSQIFSTVVSNKNATASDFMNALSEIQKQVKLKYSQLNLD
ncbi:MAG: hypothetical protein JW974_03420 [Alphaproteobacteria bacterium]|nr:hypothetical protein [Alphaproteobacteria bacterium]MBN2675288.1 hypothetical protein [Alphaproteobacteria bacterium]